MHPINVGAGVFARQFASLAERYRVICMHNPGVGATTWDGGPHAGRARPPVPHRPDRARPSPPPFHVMGNSFGGLVAQEFALQHRTECASLVLIDCSYRAGRRAGGPRPLTAIMREEFDRMYDSGRGRDAARRRRAGLEDLLLRCESMDPRIGLIYLEGLKYLPSMYARLPQIAAPTLILRGELDTMVPAEDAQVLAKGIPDARFEELAERRPLSLPDPPRPGGRADHPVPRRPRGTGPPGAGRRGQRAAPRAGGGRSRGPERARTSAAASSSAPAGADRPCSRT